MRILKSIASRVRTSVELLLGLWSGPYWWLVPVVLVLLPAAAVIILLNAAPIVAPFVYTVF